ncbi:hypothetical protein AAC978_07625 [Desulfitobacterium sp. THU1]|uniref:hypothetical protein n=1 Tax=Desulfitobacterium sp. THU1 TaxID=3138072 RepID=UPI00311D3131
MMSDLKAEPTLRELIHEAVCQGSSKTKFGRTPQQREDVAKNLHSWFEKYYGGTTNASELKRLGILDIPLSMIKKFPDNFVENIENGIRSHPGDKAKQASKLGLLIGTLNRTHHLHLDDSFVHKFEPQDRSLRLLEILKYLHSGSKTRENIAQHFEISTRHLDNDLKMLQDGFEFMGTEMKIGPLKRKANTYESPVHPIFLALNSAEIYALTVGLKLLSENTVFQQTLGRVADHVYMQLSDFARELVDNQPEAEELDFQISKRQFLSSLQMIGDYDRPFCQYIKSQQICNVRYLLKGEQKDIEGTIHLPPEGKDRFKSIYVKGIEESAIIPIDDIVGIY